MFSASALKKHWLFFYKLASFACMSPSMVVFLVYKKYEVDFNSPEFFLTRGDLYGGVGASSFNSYNL